MPQVIEITPRKSQLGESQYIAANFHMKLVAAYGIRGEDPEFRRTWEATSRLSYGRLAVELAGGDPNYVRVHCVRLERDLWTYRECDDEWRPVVLVRMHRKPVMEIVGWSAGRFAKGWGQETTAPGPGGQCRAWTMQDDQLYDVLDPRLTLRCPQEIGHPLGSDRCTTRR